MVAKLMQHCNALFPQIRRCEWSSVTSPLISYNFMGKHAFRTASFQCLAKILFGNLNMLTQIEVDQELHTSTPSRLTPDWTIQKKQEMPCSIRLCGNILSGWLRMISGLKKRISIYRISSLSGMQDVCCMNLV